MVVGGGREILCVCVCVVREREREREREKRERERERESVHHPLPTEMSNHYRMRKRRMDFGVKRERRKGGREGGESGGGGGRGCM